MQKAKRVWSDRGLEEEDLQEPLRETVPEQTQLQKTSQSRSSQRLEPIPEEDEDGSIEEEADDTVPEQQIKEELHLQIEQHWS